jgi:type I restriction enzyme M protein
MKTSAETIEKAAWKAIDVFRSQLPLSHYGRYILYLIFFKFCSDLRKDNLSGALPKTMPAWERLNIPPECDFDSILQLRNETSAGLLIDEMFHLLDRHNFNMLGRSFEELSFDRDLVKVAGDIRPLLQVIGYLAELDLRPSALLREGVIAEAFESLIGSLAEQSERIYVPPEVSSVLASALAPKSGESIYDPVCGAGMLLAELARNTGNRRCSLTGHEKSLPALSLCKMNLVLNGVEASRVEQRNPLADPLVEQDGTLKRFDVVVGNPPFGKRWDRELADAEDLGRFWRGIPPSGRSEYAFITHMIESAREAGGRVGVIAPLGVLFRGGSEATIRQRIVDENILRAVVELPPKLFYGTAIQVALLLFCKDKKSNRCLLVDASRGFSSHSGLNKLRDEDVKKINLALRTKSDISGYSRWVEHAEIEKNNYNLNVPRYIERETEVPSPFDVPNLEKEIETIETELGMVQAEIQTLLEGISFPRKSSS